MKFLTILTALSLAVLGGCARDAVGAHNYAGSPGSTYDAAINPPQAHGKATYDPLVPVTPRDFGNSGGPAPAAPAR